LISFTCVHGWGRQKSITFLSQLENLFCLMMGALICLEQLLSASIENYRSNDSRTASHGHDSSRCRIIDRAASVKIEHEITHHATGYTRTGSFHFPCPLPPVSPSSKVTLNQQLLRHLRVRRRPPGCLLLIPPPDGNKSLYLIFVGVVFLSILTVFRTAAS
jgi:hypothetical protein